MAPEGPCIASHYPRFSWSLRIGCRILLLACFYVALRLVVVPRTRRPWMWYIHKILTNDSAVDCMFVLGSPKNTLLLIHRWWKFRRYISSKWTIFASSIGRQHGQLKIQHPCCISYRPYEWYEKEENHHEGDIEQKVGYSSLYKILTKRTKYFHHSEICSVDYSHWW